MDFITSTIFADTSLASFVPLIIVILVSLVLGITISATYMLTNNKQAYSRSHAWTLAILPVVITVIIAIVIKIASASLEVAFSIAGVFTIIRFRSLPIEPKEVTYVGVALATGLACGMGYIYIAILFTLVIAVVLFVLRFVNFAEPKKNTMLLRITVPEDLNFEGAFDEVLDKYTTGYSMQRVKTSDFGSLFEIAYKISLPGKVNKKEFIDELRTINGNLNIVLTQKEFDLV